ncbi:MAG: hypothetical protein VKJ24_04640 [Synechococcales bacterium]|nr:hypothetical protein [Synechococcales bacterium]
MSHWSNQPHRQVGIEEQQLYDHLLELVQIESPAQLLVRIRHLFIEGNSYPENRIIHRLDELVLSEIADEEFRFILNRCIHILTNRWQGRPHYQVAIPELVSLLESPPKQPITEYTRTKAIKRLRELMRDFLLTEQFLALRRLADVMAAQIESLPSDRQPLGKLIRRYPYLYSHCLVTEGCSLEDQQSIRQLQEGMQRQYEIDLSQFVTYQVRRSQIFKLTESNTIGRTLYPVKNPTLLSEPALCQALHQFAGKVSQQGTQRDMAQRFLTHTQETRNFRSFKDDLYEYLVDVVDSDYGRRQFNNVLYEQLHSILPENHNQPFNEFLLLRTCSQLLNFLVVESPQNPRHFVFADLLSNIGPINTTSLLLRLVLICRKIKPYLEKRISILFNHYETCVQESVRWLVEAMEMLNIALTTNFGKMNLALVNHLA